MGVAVVVAGVVEAALVFILLSSQGAGGERRRAPSVRFQISDVATTESFLDTGLANSSIPALRQVTMLVHMRLRRVTSHIPLLSYAVPGSNEELFIELVPKKRDMHVQCCGGLVSEAIMFNLSMFTWQHIGVSINLDTRELGVIYDNLKYLVDIEIPPGQLQQGEKLEVRPGGRLVVGQKLHSMDGDFIVLETLDGELADWKLYDTALDQSQMQKLLKCQDLPELNNPILDLTSGDFQVLGPTVTLNVSLWEICGEKENEFYLYFNHKMSFKEADSWCKKLKGDLILPEDADTNAFFFDKFVRFKDNCFDIWTHMYWIGSKGNLTTRQWMKVTDGTPITWYQFLREYQTVTPEFQCIATVSHDPYKWAACPCDIESCVVCNFTYYPEMRLRGLCSDSTLDRVFSFRDNPYMRLLFDGLAHVVMEEENGTWLMRSRLYPNLRAKMHSQWEGQFPVGVHNWTVSGDKCRQKRVELLLTTCQKEEYTCDDGSCISKSSRCDSKVDCSDQSDEMNCNVVLKPPGYSEKLPPPTVSSALPISFALNITSVREFNLASFRIVIDVFLKMQWRDRRLKFANLLPYYRANKLGNWQEVWSPNLEAVDGTKSAVEVTTHSLAAYVLRSTAPLPDEDTTIREDIVYSGAGNSLILQKEQTLSFKCHFELQMYPFDRQVCFIIFELQDVTKELGILVQEGPGVMLVGSRYLLEYTLVSELLTNYTSEDISNVKVELVFKNQYSYYIGNTFTPSLLQVLISLTTLHFDLSDFQDRIMVSLTSLLVLATFFTQTSQTIPKTSYLKLIDVWFVALIFEVFAVIMSLVYIETIRLRHPPTVSASRFEVAPRSKCKDLTNLALNFKGKDSHDPAPIFKARGSPGLVTVPSKAERTNKLFIKLLTFSLAAMLICFIPVCIYVMMTD